MTLSVLIPCHNEERTVADVVRAVYAVPLEERPEVIVIDDGSTDGTAAALRALSAALPFRALTHPARRGKGAAIATGAAAATGEWLLVQDADREYRPADIPALLAATSDADAVYGVRTLRKTPARGRRYTLATRLIDLATNVLFRAHLKDTYTGAKLIRRRVFAAIAPDAEGFEFEAQVTARLLQSGSRIAQVPISYFPRGTKDGKHILARDGFKAVATLLKERVRPHRPGKY